MKIYVNASFLTIYPPTGLSRYSLSMCAVLQEKLGDKVIFLTPDDVKDKNDTGLFNVKRIGFSKKRLIWEQYDLPKYLRSVGSPLLINFGNTAPVFYKNQIVSILDVFYHHAKQVVGNQANKYPLRDRLFYRCILYIIARQSLAVLTISEFSKLDIAKTLKINESKIDVVYPTVSEFFLNDSVIRTNKRNYDYILGVSSVTPHKNFKSLILAYKKANLKNIKLVIAGNLPKDVSLTGEFANDGSIEFTGYIDDDELKTLYANAKFFVFPSKYEGFGIPPLEAMACGCPTLVSNTASMPEVCGDASHYVDPYDLDDITKGIQLMNDDDELRENLVRNAKERILRYHRAISAEKLLDVMSRYSQ